MKTGNTPKHIKVPAELREPQWSPVMKTGNTSQFLSAGAAIVQPQWSPVMKTGNTCGRPWPAGSATSSLNGARS